MINRFVIFISIICNINSLNIINKLFNNKYIDLDNFYNYKKTFQNENYNDIIKDILNNKIEKIYIDVNYKEIFTIDNFPKNDYINNHYHFSNIDPILLPNLIEKVSNLNIPLYFINLKLYDIIEKYEFQIIFVYLLSLVSLIRIIYKLLRSIFLS